MTFDKCTFSDAGYYITFRRYRRNYNVIILASANAADVAGTVAVRGVFKSFAVFRLENDNIIAGVNVPIFAFFNCIPLFFGAEENYFFKRPAIC